MPSSHPMRPLAAANLLQLSMRPLNARRRSPEKGCSAAVDTSARAPAAGGGRRKPSQGRIGSACCSLCRSGISMRQLWGAAASKTLTVGASDLGAGRARRKGKHKEWQQKTHLAHEVGEHGHAPKELQALTLGAQVAGIGAWGRNSLVAVADVHEYGVFSARTMRTGLNLRQAWLPVAVGCSRSLHDALQSLAPNPRLMM